MLSAQIPGMEWILEFIRLIFTLMDFINISEPLFQQAGHLSFSQQE
jgi:hypothetical protein